MNYILNTKTKKVEIYWDNQNEYQALINFLSDFTITEEQNTYTVKNPDFAKQESITWAVNNLPNSYTINGSDIALGSITSHSIIDTTYSDKIEGKIADITATITADDITNALKSEPKE